jgi:UDP-arabinose 4-epimerase
MTDKAAVLVTGGAGYIGSHTCKALAQVGYLPVTYDNLIGGHNWAVRWGPLEEGDILNPGRLNEVIGTYLPVAAIHFAAFAYVGESVANPAKYYHNNICGSLSLLDALRRHGNIPLVFSSSCATYGAPDTCPIGESTRQVPINPYGFTKLAVERMLSDYHAAYGLRAVALRYFNAAGADRDSEIGERHEPETHLIPQALKAMDEDAEALAVFGTDFPTPDGTAIRDYVHVEDLAAVHLAAMTRLLAGGTSDCVNVGTGKGASVREVIAVAERVTGRSVYRFNAPRRAGDPPKLVSDPSRLKTALGMDPALFMGLEAIIASAWRWHTRLVEREAA